MLFVLDHVPGKRVPLYPVKHQQTPDVPIVVIKRDDWNDYWYYTACDVFVFMNSSAPAFELGRVRIMYRDQQEDVWVFETWRDETFTHLPDDYVSLGRSLEFYENLRSLGEDFGSRFLRAIRDAAYSHDLWDSFKGDICFNSALLRDTSVAIEIRDVVPRMFGLRADLIDVFSYVVHLPGAPVEHRVTFNFAPESAVPHRAMLLVGPNGTGKTQLLANLAIALTGVTQKLASEDATRASSLRKRRGSGVVDPLPSIYQVIAISFNVFDRFEIPTQDPHAQIRYTYSGIRRLDGSILGEDDLLIAIKSAVSEMDEERRLILVDTLTRVLGSETAHGLIDARGTLQASANQFYEQRSAGQRIVLNTLTHLIANLRERSLVLLDEPETHLHPSLITTLVSEILHLLDNFSSYAIMATHSPLIAQQVPSRRIRVLRRGQGTVHVNTPSIECFGENLSEISNVLFETREFERDYTSVLEELLAKHDNDPDAVENLFPMGLGANARIYLRSAANRGRLEA